MSISLQTMVIPRLGGLFFISSLSPHHPHSAHLIEQAGGFLKQLFGSFVVAPLAPACMLVCLVHVYKWNHNTKKAKIHAISRNMSTRELSITRQTILETISCSLPKSKDYKILHILYLIKDRPPNYSLSCIGSSSSYSSSLPTSASKSTVWGMKP